MMVLPSHSVKMSIFNLRSCLNIRLNEIYCMYSLHIDPEIMVPQGIFEGSALLSDQPIRPPGSVSSEPPPSVAKKTELRNYFLTVSFYFDGFDPRGSENKKNSDDKKLEVLIEYMNYNQSYFKRSHNLLPVKMRPRKHRRSSRILEKLWRNPSLSGKLKELFGKSGTFIEARKTSGRFEKI